MSACGGKNGSVSVILLTPLLCQEPSPAPTNITGKLWWLKGKKSAETLILYLEGTLYFLVWLFMPEFHQLQTIIPCISWSSDSFLRACRRQYLQASNKMAAWPELPIWMIAKPVEQNSGNNRDDEVHLFKQQAQIWWARQQGIVASSKILNEKMR